MTYSFEFYLSTDGLSADDVSHRLVSLASGTAGVYFTDQKSGGDWWACSAGSSAILADSGALILEIHASAELVRELLDDALADGAPQSILGSDVFAKLTLAGDSVDWTAVRSLWEAIASTWPTIARSDGSGYDASIDSLP